MHVISPVLILTYSLIGLISAYVAKKKGRNPYLWFSLGVFFGVLALIVMYLISSKSSKKSLIQKPAIPAPILDSKLWYYLNQDEQVGPISLNKLSNLLKEGKINLNTYVWNEELDAWKFLNETKEYNLLIEKST